jgi:hypothetical protein
MGIATREGDSSPLVTGFIAHLWDEIPANPLLAGCCILSIQNWQKWRIFHPRQPVFSLMAAYPAFAG